jgi:hypothetical protein
VTTDDRSTFADGLPTGGDVTANWTVLQPVSFVSSNGAVLNRLADNSILASGPAPLTDTYTVVANTSLTNITGIRLEALKDPSLPQGGPGRAAGNGNFVLTEFQASIVPSPPLQGVQFWLSGLPGTNAPGALFANIWDTSVMPHVIALTNNVITNGGWQHVALTFDATNRVASLYTNGNLAVSRMVSSTNFVPRTTGDLFLGYHPGLTNFTGYKGGLDEFSIYERAITPCEVAAIYHAGTRGKYGTNVTRVRPNVTRVRP